MLLCKPAGLFGKPLQVQNVLAAEATREPVQLGRRAMRVAMAALAVLALAAPWFVYPFLMKVLCFALFAAAFNLLVGYVGCCPSATRPSSARRPMPPASS